MVNERGYCMMDLPEINLEVDNLKRANLEKANFVRAKLR